MLSSKGLYEKKCKRCNLTFRTDNPHATTCSPCRLKAEKEYQKAYRDSHKKEAEKYRKQHKKKPSTETIPLREYTAIIKNYNDLHNTNYSYGQFELLQFLGKITLGGEKE